MYENMQNAEWKVDEGEKWADPSLAGEKGLYPDSIKDYQKQRYKPYLANKNAAAWSYTVFILPITEQFMRYAIRFIWERITLIIFR